MTSEDKIRNSCYGSQKFKKSYLRSEESVWGSGQALSKFNKIKKINRRLGPVHSDIMPQIQLKESKDLKKIPIRKCSSDTKRVDFFLPEIPNFLSTIEKKSQYYSAKVSRFFIMFFK